MINGASQLGAAVSVAVLPSRSETPVVRLAVPVILRATRAEAFGARARVGGQRVVNRAIRQLARVRDARVVIASDGSVPLPRHLPRHMERRELEGDVPTALAALTRELGPETTTVGADMVWLQPGRFEKGVVVVDAASRREAGNLLFEELQRGERRDHRSVRPSPRMCCKSTRVRSTRPCMASSIRVRSKPNGRCRSSAAAPSITTSPPQGRRQLTVEARDWERMSNAIARVMKLA